MDFLYPAPAHLYSQPCHHPPNGPFVSFQHRLPPSFPNFYPVPYLSRPPPPPAYGMVIGHPLPVLPVLPPWEPQIRQVWSNNVGAEFKFIWAALHSYTCASMDTEFPGTIYTPDKPYYNVTPAERYSILKSNVDDLKLIQLGLTLSDPAGRLPDLTWEFNLRGFDVKHDKQNAASISLLKNQGLDFDLINKEGIDCVDFARHFLASGLIGNGSRISWVAFSGAYDFAYLVKIISQKELPETMEDFLQLITAYFGKFVYDIKHIRKHCSSKLEGGLEKTASELNVGRAAGKCHQAGSDSLLTAQVWSRLREMLMQQGWNGHGSGILCGLQVL